MGDTSYRLDYVAAERDIRALRKQVDKLLICAQKVEDDAITYLHDDGKVLWEDRLATAHFGQAADCVRNLRKLADYLDEVAKGIESTVTAYREAEQG